MTYQRNKLRPLEDRVDEPLEDGVEDGEVHGDDRDHHEHDRGGLEELGAGRPATFLSSAMTSLEEPRAPALLLDAPW